MTRMRYGLKFIELFYINISLFQNSLMRPKDRNFSPNYQMRKSFLKRPPQLPLPLSLKVNTKYTTNLFDSSQMFSGQSLYFGTLVEPDIFSDRRLIFDMKL